MNMKRCEIVSHLKDNDGNTLFDINNMKLILVSKKCIKDYCYIIHDKDTYTDKDEEANAEHKVGELKPAHIHLLIRFQDNQPQDSKYISKWFNISENFVNKIKGKWQDALRYQCHINAPKKYQYSVDEITCNFDYQSAIEKKSNNKDSEVDDILMRILSGNIREYNKTLEIDNMLLVKYAKRINEAFKVRQEHLEATAKERNTEVIFITGASGSGKTTLAKKIAQSRNLEYYISSGSNDVMDGYRQQPVLILDDLRPSCMGLSDLLKCLDNYNTSSVKSRYKNKFLCCDLIIITTVLNIDTFYENVFENEKEPITQLKRRCGIYIRMDRENINISIWDNKTMRYTNEVEYKNNMLDDIIPTEKKTIDDVKSHISSIMPFLQLDENPFNLTPIKSEVAL
ncbi:MAG: hypothetical protein IJ141_00730 [Lachnospiraceae bacterium]|nr:hypothetical protein [Lachnospiraceae bacterium]